VKLLERSSLPYAEKEKSRSLERYVRNNTIKEKKKKKKKKNAKTTARVHWILPSADENDILNSSSSTCSLFRALLSPSGTIKVQTYFRVATRNYMGI
jgi:hypothetical protein